jgi:protein-tyrosine phosphatase
MIRRFVTQWFEPAGPAAAAPRWRVLMVCHGNICRSPIAEGVLRAMLRKADLHRLVHVESAGTHGYHTGEPPDPRAIRIAASTGYDIAGQRARPVVQEDFRRFDWMLAMDADNLDWLLRHAPQAAQVRIEPLLAQARPALPERWVPDPYFGSEAGFERVIDLVQAGCSGWVQALRESAERPAAR